MHVGGYGQSKRLKEMVWESHMGVEPLFDLKVLCVRAIDVHDYCLIDIFRIMTSILKMGENNLSDVMV